MGRHRMPLDKVRSDRLIQMMAELGMSQLKFAESVDISHETISGIVNLRQPMTEVIALRILEVYPQYDFIWLMNYDKYVEKYSAAYHIIKLQEDEEKRYKERKESNERL